MCSVFNFMTIGDKVRDLFDDLLERMYCFFLVKTQVYLATLFFLGETQTYWAGKYGSTFCSSKRDLGPVWTESRLSPPSGGVTREAKKQCKLELCMDARRPLR